MALYLAPIVNDQQVDSNGAPLSGGFVYTYLAGSSSPYPTYTDNTGVTPQSNPVILNTLGLPPSPIWLQGGTAYKFIIRDSLGVLQRTIDNVSGINDAAVSVSQWVVFGSTPTYISPTTFSVAGDQTGVFQVGRRIQVSVTAGTLYGTITNAAFSTLTTVTLSLDSGVLDSGLSTVALGLITATNTSIPDVYSHYGIDSGSANTYIVNSAIGSVSLAAGVIIRFVAKFSNTGASTLSLNGSSAVSLTPDGVTAALPGQVSANALIEAVFDGTRWQIINPYAIAATTTIAGVSRYGTNAEQLSLTPLSNVACTPAGLASARSYGASGYQKLQGGLILQWGSATTTISGVTVTFPVTFPTGAMSISIGSNAASGTIATFNSLAASNVLLQAWATSGAQLSGQVVHYHVIGY